MPLPAKDKKRKILVTGALPYANGSLHLGHMVEYLMADFWVRFQKMRGHECRYFCADDTHGTPIMVKARELGVTPQAMVEKSQAEHFKDFTDFGVEFDHYSSTNSDENKKRAEEFYLAMRDQGHVVIREIDQLYCNHDKMFLPDRFVKGTCPKCGAIDQYGDSCDKCGATYSPTEMKSVRCSICANPPVEKQSSHVFFKLNDFKEFLKAWVPQHTSSEISNKLKEWFDEDLRDWDISRDDPYFGFEIPGLVGKYFYVWVDAPIGYVSTTEQWCKKNGKDLLDYWKNPEAEIHHFIGKDIVYFHTLFWPAMLKTAGYNLPTSVKVHGHLTVNGEKMSKSKGTFIMARTYLNYLSPMYLRYYYACKISGLNDLDLNIEDFVGRVNSDLVGKITNLASRGAQMLFKRLDGRMVRPDAEGEALMARARAQAETIAGHYENLEYAKALTEIRALADEGNRYFDEKAPWKLINEDPEKTRVVLSTVLNLFRAISIFLKPVLPVYADQVAQLFGEAPYVWSDLEATLGERKIGEYQHLATRMELEQAKKMVQPVAGTEAVQKATAGSKANEKKSAKSVDVKAATPTDGTPALIDFEDFAKVDLRVVKIIEAEEIKEADKLLRLKVDLGGETRTIIAGIKSAYSAQDLVGRLTVVVANLKPRQMKFGVSEGMVLAAGPGGKELFILSPDSGAQAGQKVK